MKHGASPPCKAATQLPDESSIPGTLEDRIVYFQHFAQFCPAKLLLLALDKVKELKARARAGQS